MKKIDTLKFDTLNVIDIMSMTDDEAEREVHQIDINQEIVIPSLEPHSLFSDSDDEYEPEFDDEGNKKKSKLHRQRKSLNQARAKDSDVLLMETSLMITDHESMSPPPFSPPPLPLSPHTNIVTTSFNREVGFLSLPLKSTTGDPSTSEQRHKHVHHRHHHRHHHKHRHSMAVGRTAPLDEREQPSRSGHQPPEREIVLSPSKLGQ